MSPAPRRAGFTLLEAVVAVVFVALFALLLFSSVRASTAVSNDVVVGSETSQLATELVRRIEERLIRAEVEQPPPAVPAPTSTSFAFVQRIEDPADPTNVVFGADVSDLRAPVVGGMVRFRWVASPSPRAYGPGLAPGFVTEDLVNADLDGDGDVQPGSAEQYQVGHLVMDFLDDTGSPLADQPTVELGRRSPTRVLWSPTRLPPIFSRADDPTQVVSVPFPAGDAGVRINLTVMHDPVPGPGGARSTSVFRVSRVVSPR